MCLYIEYLVATVRAAHKYFSWIYASHLPPPRFPPPLPNFFIETFLQYVRVSNIVLLVKYNFSTINVTTQGSTKRSLTEETLSTMLVNFILKMQSLVS